MTQKTAKTQKWSRLGTPREMIDIEGCRVISSSLLAYRILVPGKADAVWIGRSQIAAISDEPDKPSQTVRMTVWVAKKLHLI